MSGLGVDSLQLDSKGNKATGVYVKSCVKKGKSGQCIVTTHYVVTSDGGLLLSGAGPELVELGSDPPENCHLTVKKLPKP